MQMRSLFKNQKGTILFEVLGAIILLAILILMFTFFVEGVRQVGFSKTRNQATQIAQRKMEELKDRDYGTIVAEISHNSHCYNEKPVVDDKRFNCTVDVTVPDYIEQAHGDIDDAMRITVTVNWEQDQRRTILVCDRVRP